MQLKLKLQAFWERFFSECPKLYVDCWLYIYLDCNYTKAILMAIKLNLFNLNRTG